jgi:mono/diheme cytochrome c family protein
MAPDVGFRAVVLLWLGLSTAASLRAEPQAPSAGNALPANRSGADIYGAACSACHGPDGAGAPRTVVGFAEGIPDFRDCAFATAEPDPDWFAVVHQGGPVRALDRRMPAFGDALTSEDIELVLGHVRTFCREPAWPRGDLNFPRAFFTEKAFPETETVWTTAVATGGSGAVGNELLYERRFGARNQIEVSVPIDFQEGTDGVWARGIGDVSFGFKRAIAHTMRTGSIVSAGAEVIVPTGNEDKGLGGGVTVFEPFAMWGQMLPANGFFQMHGGIEFPSDPSKASREGFVRSAIGTTFAQERGFGRAWSPQLELLWAKPFDGTSEWDLVPQLQVSLSKLQHVLASAGVRIPLSQRDERHPQVLLYLLWDWFDGGFFQFWR